MEKKVICYKHRKTMDELGNLTFDDTQVTRYRCPYCGTDVMIAWES